MIDQSHATVRNCDNGSSRYLNAIPLTLFGIVSFVLVISGCTTNKGARTASKPADKHSIVSKYLPAEKKAADKNVPDEQVATTKKQPAQDKGLSDESLSQADDGLIKPVRSIQTKRIQATDSARTDSTPREEKTAEFTDLFNRGADDKSRTPRYDAE